MRTSITILSMILTILITSGCQEEPQKGAGAEKNPQPGKELTERKQNASNRKEADSKMANQEQAANKSTEAETTAGVPEDKTPPQPPLLEDFQGQPQLSLFPRVGDYKPQPDSDRHPYWLTFIDHLIKVTGVAENQEDGSRGWVFRSVNTIDSLGYFAPLAVEPNKSYQVSFKLKADLPEGATAGIGVLEFNEFLWLGEQYTEETFQKHYRGVNEGIRLSGKVSGAQNFSFTTGPDTRMIHLVLFRDGTHDRNALMFDDIEIK